MNVLEVVISGDSTKLTKALQTATQSVTKFGSALTGSGKSQVLDQIAVSADNLGRKLLPLTASVAGFSLAGGKAAADYQRSFSTITGLVGLASDEVEGLAQSTLSLAKATAVGPQELAEAMFVIQSAGIQGAAGLDALEIAARSSAAGMGSTSDNARALTGALNAYASTGLTAAEAGDALAATARAGNFETSQLASSLGRVLPVASQMGVSIQEVGGAIALLTRNGTSASESVTQIRAVLNSMLSPSEETTRNLTAMGISMSDLRNTLQEQGLVAALQEMYLAAGESDETFAKMIGSSEAVGAAFSIMTADAATLDATFGAVANSTGVLDEAFNAAADTADFKFQAALASLKASTIEIGALFAPAIAQIVSFGAEITRLAVAAFGALPGPIQTATAGLIGLAGAAGPLLILTAKLITAFQFFASLKFATTIATFVTGLSGFSSAAAIASTGMAQLSTAASGFASGTLGITAATKTATAGLGTLAAGAGLAAIKLGLIGGAVALAIKAYQEWRDVSERTEASVATFNTALIEVPGSASAIVAALEAMSESLNGTATAAANATDGTATVAAVASGLADNLDDGAVTAVAKLGLSFTDLAEALPTAGAELATLSATSVSLAGDYNTAGLAGEEWANVMRDRLAPDANSLTAALLDGVAAGDITKSQALELAESLGLQADALRRVTDEAAATAQRTIEVGINQEIYSRSLVDSLIATNQLADGTTDWIAVADRLTSVMSTSAAETNRFAAAADLHQASTATAVDATEQFVSSLERFDDTTDLVTDALAGHSDAVVELVGSTVELAGENETLTGSFDALAGAINEVKGELDALNGVQKSAIETQIQIEGAFESFEGTLEELAGTTGGTAEAFDLTTAAGRSLTQTIGGIAEDTRDYALAVAAETGSLEASRAAYQQRVNDILASADAAGLNREEVERLVAIYGELPDAAIIEVISNADEARADFEEAEAAFRDFDGTTVEAKILVDNLQAIEANAEVLLELDRITATEAVAQISADANPFNETTAAALLALAGFSNSEARALITGDSSVLNETLIAALIQLDQIDATEATAEILANADDADATLSGFLLALDQIEAAQVEAVIEANAGAANDVIADVLVQLGEVSRAEATAILAADNNPFNDATSAALLTLADIDGTTAEALLTGDPSDLNIALAAALVELGQIDAQEFEATIGADTTNGDAQVAAFRTAVEDVTGQTYEAVIATQADTAAIVEFGQQADAAVVTRELFLASNANEVAADAANLGTAADQATVDRNLNIATNFPAATGEANGFVTAANLAAAPRTFTLNSNLTNVTGQANTLTAAANAATAARTLTVSSNVAGTTTQVNNLATRAAAATAPRRLTISSNVVGTTTQVNNLALRAAAATVGRTLTIGSNIVGVTAQANTLSSRVDYAARNRALSIAVSASTGSAESAINYAARNRTATITVRTENTTQNANFRADGGIDTGTGVLAFAQGGIRKPPSNENHVAQIAPAGAWRVWAEPETGGEAYIPLAASKRPRSRQILEKTASMFGLQVVPMNNGGIITPPNTGAPRNSVTNSNQITIAEGAIRIDGIDDLGLSTTIRRELDTFTRNLEMELASR